MNCKTGDLAVVIRSRNPDSLGAIVEVVRPFNYSLRGASDPMWWVRTTGRVLTAVGGFSGDRIPCREGGIEDRHLRPISGIPEPDFSEAEVMA